jgi:hypothetical protein
MAASWKQWRKLFAALDEKKCAHVGRLWQRYIGLPAKRAQHYGDLIRGMARVSREAQQADVDLVFTWSSNLDDV